jgi:hypothetical protein
MYQATATARNISYPYHTVVSSFRTNRDTIMCDWPSLRAQLLTQWERLTGRELDMAERDRHEIAILVQRKYGVSARLVENYLSNLERTLPALSA